MSDIFSIRSRPRDAGIASLCSQLADMYPAMLSNWTATIQDSSLRQRAFAALTAPRGG